MKHLAELGGVLFPGELEVTADEDEHDSVDARRLAINGGDLVKTLLKGERGEFSNDVMSTLDLLTLKSEHGTFLIEVSKCSTISIEGGVVVLYECFHQCI
ncbi:unnamed protein product [Lupinus luteus]|uniref:Uncharacterized protein n=1 Tax=Lupinus luteus TaxID=3873 RepID=A0AAV1WZK5_LUPLU